ncbi:MAG: ATP-binding cassette domain-containing protein [Clostridia bacterium]|nr:ATP-binding cassette domain-containing protein [Clostridia bacterium]MBP5245129.1 ATP-binding cassette domain-containing protein [Clostridia bacterium]MBR4978934.1 ATP-binding cassette domain-containing protein [Clostridia bacterium]
MIELQNVYKSFVGRVDVVKLFEDFSFNVKDGSFVSIIGSNGSGKTTLLNLVCGSIAPDSGKILFDGSDFTSVPEYKRSMYIGRVHQNPQNGTCPDLTIVENMALADNKGKHYGFTPAVNRKRIDYYKELVSECGMGLENRMNVKVGSLSGGQRQALALVIANMSDNKFLVLDEHTAALDPKTSENIMTFTDRIVKEKGITTLMVTHNLRYALEYGDRIVMMHEGKIVLDKEGEEKKALNINDVLGLFNSISIECGN